MLNKALYSITLAWVLLLSSLKVMYLKWNFSLLYMFHTAGWLGTH